ncbi:MAG: hypothetical protein GY780_18845 [bacterium]|nr:hypothetical protein [bacterium]
MTDNLIGLMWTKNATIWAVTVTWDEAIENANNLSLGNQYGQRLLRVAGSWRQLII